MVGIGSPKIRVDKDFQRIVKENIGILGATSAQVTREIARTLKRFKK